MFAKAVAALGFIASALAITINTPSPSSFWVQNVSNTITWTFNQGDPNPIFITVTNSNSSILNGQFAIQNGVDLSNGTFTVTNVTLLTDSGYVVNFVNGSNLTQVYASSQPFDVKVPGTPPAQTGSPSGSSSPSATGGNSSASGSTSTSGAVSAPTKSNGAAMRLGDAGFKVSTLMLATGVMTLVGAFITF
jgi:hypothetical protein